MKNNVWLLGDTIVDELYDYKNLGGLKNYVGSFSLNVESNPQKKFFLIFALILIVTESTVSST